MLVLTRKKGQKLMINDNICVQLLEIGKGQIKLGIMAPKDMSIHREEIWLKIKEAQQMEVTNA